MEKLKALIENSENWLLKKIIELAKDKDYTRYSSTLEEAWRIMVRGLSEPLLLFLSGKGDLDRVAAGFALEEARLHRNRGVPPVDFIGLLKCCRRGYRDLLRANSSGEAKLLRDLIVLDEYFDYLEMQILAELTRTGDSLTIEMQKQNRQLTNEKNRFLTIFESLVNPVFYLNRDNRLTWMNQAARKLAEDIGDPTTSYYFMEDPVDAPGWLLSATINFQAFARGDATYPINLATGTGAIRHLEIKLSRMADVSGKFAGTIAILNDLTKYHRAKNELQAAYSQLHQVFSSVPSGLVVISAERDILKVNEQFAHWIGLEPRDLMQKKCHQIFQLAECHTKNCFLKQAVRDGTILRREKELNGKNGFSRYVIMNIAPIYGAEGNFAGTVLSIEDISKRKRSEEELKNYHKLFLLARDVILFIRIDGQILDANDAAIETYGYSQNELLALSIDDLRLPGTEGDHHKQMLEAYNRGIQVQTTHRRKDGSLFPVEVSASGINLAGEKAVISIVRDITDRLKSEERIRYLGFHDKLTGLYNRAYLDKKLKSASAKEYPYSIIMGDVNGLKITNDAFGHEVGDKLLKAIAEILQASCRSEDIVARSGGDEFVILLPGLDEQTALSVVKRIKHKCLKSGFQPIQPSISLGLAAKTGPEHNILQVFQEAETKMYRRKMLEADSARSFSIQSLQQVLQERGYETEEHTERLRTMVRLLAEELNLSSAILDELDLLATLHDIGKIAIPAEILNKSGPLLDEEWEIMKRHPEIGYRIARASYELEPIAECILAHHERWDGKGYPRGLAGEQIPLCARILAVVDAYDVMVNGRPYRAALSHCQAIRELQDNSGTQFDPTVVAAFLAFFAEKKMSPDKIKGKKYRGN